MTAPADKQASLTGDFVDAGIEVTTLPQPAEGEISTIAYPASASLRPEGPRASEMIGHYRVLREIARGGMGVVYLVQDVQLKRLVALKMILSGQMASEQEVARFQTEAEASAKLDHPHIVPVYETGEHGGRPFLAMAYLPGESLDRRIAQGPLPPREAAKILESVASAVDYAHRQGVVHRDIKPRNILFDQGGQPRITDFGLAKQLDQESELTATGQIVGTPSYMSPEQAQGRLEEVGALSDVYGLGATLYCLVTGRPPFQAATAIETVRQVIDLEPPPPRQLNAAVPRDLDTICLKCLQKEPSRRYGSADELAEELERFLSEQPIRARPISRLERIVRWRRRNPAAAGLIFASLAALLFLAAAAGYRGQMKRTEAARRSAQALADAQAGIAAAAKALAEANRQTAATQEYYSLVNKTREQIASPSLGWTWQAVADLERAARLDTSAKDAAELRTLTAGALTSVDVRLEGAVGVGVSAAEITFSPDGRRLAVAEWKKVPAISIYVYDVDSRDLVATYSVSTWDNFARVFKNQSSFQEGFRSVAFSPDGRWLAAGTRIGRLYIWDATKTDPAPLHRWTVSADQEEVKNLAFSETGDAIYTTHARVRFDPQDGWQEAERFAEPIRHFGKRPGDLYHELDEGGSTSAFLEDANHLVAVSYDSRRAAARTSRGTIEVFDLPSRTGVWKLRDLQTGGEKLGAHVTFVAEGSLLFSQDEDEAMRIWDLASGTLVCRVPCDGQSSPLVAVDRASDRFALATTRETRIYQLRRSSAASAVGFQSAPVFAAALSDAGDAVATAAEAKEANGSRASTVSVWDTTSGALQAESAVFAHRNPDGTPLVMPYDADLSADNVIWNGDAEVVVAGGAAPPRRISLTGDADAVFFPLSKARLLVFQEDALRQEGSTQLADDPSASDGRALGIAGKGSASLPLQESLDAKSADAWLLFAAVRCDGALGAEPEVSAGLSSADQSSLGAWVRPFSPSGRYQWLFIDAFSRGWLEERGAREAIIRLETDDADARIWIDCLVAIPTPDTPSKYPVRSLCRVPDRNLLLGLVDRHTVVAWRTPDMQIAWERQNSLVTLISGSNPLNCLVAGEEWTVAGTELGDLMLLNTATGQVEKMQSGAQELVPLRAATAIPGESLVAVGDAQGALKLVRLPEGNTVFRTEAHRRSIDSLAASADGQTLVSGGRDRMVKIWRREGDLLQLAYSLPAFSGAIRSLDLDARASTLAVVVEGERAVRLWRLEELAEEFEARGIP